MWRGRLPREILRETRESYVSRELSHLRRDEAEERLDCALGTNPLGVAPAVEAFLAQPQRWDPAAYPSAVGETLREELAAYLGAEVTPEQIVLGHGSFDVLTHLMQFTDVPLQVMLNNVRYHPVVLRPPFFEAEEESWMRAARIHPHVLYVDRPNNPTGQVMPRNVLESLCALCARHGAWVVADEAYGEYLPLEESAIQIPAPNLVVTRSFSKAWGLAGVRVGYGVVRDPELLEIFRKTQPPFSLGTPGMVLASVALGDPSFLETTRRYVRTAKARLLEALTRPPELVPSATDERTPILVLSSHRGNLFDRLNRAGIATEPGTGYMDLDERAVRLRVPPPDELEPLLRRLHSVGVALEAEGPLPGRSLADP